MYKLYHSPHSQHARRVVSLLEESGLDYELRNIAMETGEYLSEDYSLINPNQQVPTLMDGSIKIHESNAILRYLCIKHNLTNWYPDDLAQRAAVEQWLDWNQCRLSPSVVDIVLNKVFMGDQADLDAIKRGEENLPKLLTILESGLQGQYLTGDTATIADLSVASNIFQLSLAETLPTEPKVIAWYKRINAMDGFKKSLPAN